MSTVHDLNPFRAKIVLAEVLQEAQRRPVLRSEDYQRTEIAESYLRNTIERDARGRWLTHCPTDFHESDWNHPDLDPRNRDAINRILTHSPNGKGLIASGPTGGGKSRAMWALMRRLACEEHRDVRYWQACDWFSTLDRQIQYGRDDAGGWIETVARKPLVFIDDVGQEALQQTRKDWALSWFFRFLDIRVGEKLPLYITTNMSAEDFSNWAVSGIRHNALLRRILAVCEPVKFV